MKLYNTLTRQVDEFALLEKTVVRMYSCGPTVYDHIHIGNLSAFIYADMLRRVITASGYEVQHVMNFTDVDDKTIRRSAEKYPDESPEVALQKLTDEYKDIFLNDMKAIGNDIDSMQFVSAVDSLQQMRDLITQLYKDGFAYIADDGVYFSIEKYRASGKTYGQLLKLDEGNTSSARIDNDEYDKESVHDFALWKTRKEGEPAWEFELDGHNLLGRPGWHIECSAMSAQALGQPFDVHTGGVDLIFPHHENEIAQSTAGKDSPTMATYFVHNEHLLVDGKKMSKSLNNFFTLRDIQEKGFDPLAFRMMVLQSHYRSQSNFTWENLEAAQNRLKNWSAVVDLRWQAVVTDDNDKIHGVMRADLFEEKLSNILQDDMNTAMALAFVDEVFNEASNNNFCAACMDGIVQSIDEILGINLFEGKADISDDQKQILSERQKARDDKNWARSDELRDQLKEQGIAIRDTDYGQIWHRL